MSVKLITGTRIEKDIKSEDDGARIYATISGGDKVLDAGEKFGYSIISNNCVRIKSGEILIQGRHVRQSPGTYTDLTIDNGNQGQKRNDIIVMRYTKESGTDLESAELAVTKGTPGENAIDPEITTGDIYTGCLIHEMPLYRVSLNGLNIESVTQMFNTLGRLENITELIYPVGAIYMSVNDVNPSTLFGGTWERWGNGRVPVGVDEGDADFSAAEKIGGEKTHKLTIDELARHAHYTSVYTGGGTATNFAGTGGSDIWANSDTGVTGGDVPHNNLQPYITCYMWRRTA